MLQSLALRCNGTVTRFSQARVVDVEISHRLVHPDQPHLLADEAIILQRAKFKATLFDAALTHKQIDSGSVDLR